jgi:hypothetical protein
MSVILLTNVFPGMPSGQAVVLGRLLEGIDQRVVKVVGSFSASQASPSIAGKYSSLPDERVLQRLSPSLEFAFRVLLRAHHLCALFRSTGSEMLIACSGDPFNMPAAALAARRCSVGLTNYLFDDYREQWALTRFRSAARFVEKKLLTSASCNIVTNEFMRVSYTNRYQCTTQVVPNPYSDEWVSSSKACSIPEQKPRSIFFAGSIYHVNREAFVCLVRALDLLGENWRLALSTSQSAGDLTRMGLSFGRAIVSAHSDTNGLMDAVRSATLLYLPLGFSKGVQGVVSTALPAKFPEYLVSGRPMLVHSPADSFVADYVKRNCCSYLVDSLSSDQLAETISKAGQNTAEQSRFVERAIHCGQRDFSPKHAQTMFLNAIGLAEQVKLLQ